MSDIGIQYFALLKKIIVGTLKQTYPSVPDTIESWKGQDIVYFQEDLLTKVKGSISEKWFYTHLKLEGNKLPRIDMLNLLSRYAGFTDWNDFKGKNKLEIPHSLGKKHRLNLKSKNSLIFLPLLLVLSIIMYFVFKPKTYTFCFYDANQQTLLDDQNIEIIVLNDNESPIYKRCEKGCFYVNSSNSKLRFVVKTPYYITDTITRYLHNRDRTENVKLRANEYAMMIHYFSKTKANDWQKRKRQLNAMFTDNAQIYQMYGDEELGMELYNKTEFINKLSMPVHSIANIDVLETIYTGNKISVLKFRQLNK